MDDVIINNATVTINKVDSTLTVEDIAFDYGCSGSGSLSFEGATGVDATTDNNGQVKVAIGSLVPKEYLQV